MGLLVLVCTLAGPKVRIATSACGRGASWNLLELTIRCTHASKSKASDTEVGSKEPVPEAKDESEAGGVPQHALSALPLKLLRQWEKAPPGLWVAAIRSARFSTVDVCKRVGALRSALSVVSLSLVPASDLSQGQVQAALVGQIPNDIKHMDMLQLLSDRGVETCSKPCTTNAEWQRIVAVMANKSTLFDTSPLYEEALRQLPNPMDSMPSGPGGSEDILRLWSTQLCIDQGAITHCGPKMDAHQVICSQAVLQHSNRVLCTYNTPGITKVSTHLLHFHGVWGFQLGTQKGCITLAMFSGNECGTDNDMRL